MKRILTALLALCITITAICPFVVFADEKIGESISWQLENGTLTISGSGAMPDFEKESDAPWFNDRLSIERIVVSEGVTAIGNLAFYGCSNAKNAEIADSVKSVGINAFSYTEGSATGISDIDAKYQFAVSCEKDYVKAGEEFYADLTLSGDFKNVSALQAIVIFDPVRISADIDDWCDTEWLETVDKTNFGYISQPLNGVVSNTVRLMYISLAGNKIDEDAPLYNAGETSVKIARLKFKAIADIENFDVTALYIKECQVSLSGQPAPKCSMVQLTSATILPISDLKIITGSKEVSEYASSKNIAVQTKDGADYAPEKKDEQYDGITVLLDGKKIEFDVEPILVQDRTLVPMRAIFEALGAKVDWDDEKQTAFGMNANTIVAFQIDNNKMQKSTVDGKSETITLDVPAMLINDRTLVPLRAISESFGNNVDWIDETQTVVITLGK